MPVTTPRTVAIVGAGFSGTATALHLLRRLRHHAHRIVLIDRAPEVGRGIAYARRKYPYLLNVPASRMSATPLDPDEFLRFVQRRQPMASGADFVQREVYGDYLQAMLKEALEEASGRTRFEMLHSNVTDLVQALPDGPFTLSFERAGELAADHVVLALGNPPPARLLSALPVVDHPAYVSDPWSNPWPKASQGPTLIIGTGLTMVDLAMAILAGDPRCEIDALSRHGLMPRYQTDFGAELEQAVAIERAVDGATSLREMVRVVVAAARRANSSAGDWRDVVMLVRHRLPYLWMRLEDRDRRRFLRHVQAYWDIHRHRAPAMVAERLEKLRETGQLKVHAGRLTAMSADGALIRARWQARGTREVRERSYARVFNCTGPGYDVGAGTDPFWRSLLERDLIAADPLGLGLRTGPLGETVSRNGTPVRGLFYVGPLLRARYWEATAVGELRGHADRLAAHLAALQRSAAL